MIADLKPYLDYNVSGLPWLGQMPEHWSQERAKWLFTKMARPTGDNDDVVTCFRDGTVTLRKNRRLRGFTEAIYEFGYQGIRKDDLVIHAMDAFAGAVGVSDSDGKGTPVYAVCQPKPGINAHYFAFVVREMARSQWILALSRGIRERSTDFRYDTFGGQRVPLPPPDEQAAIVRFLDWANGRLERAIRAKRKVIALLNEQKQAIIHRAVTRGLDPSVPLKPSGIPWLGDIPRHWDLTPLGALTRYISYGFTNPMPVADEGPYMLTAADIAKGEIQYATARHTSEYAFQHLLTDKSRPRSGDLLITKDGTLGRIAVADGTRVCINQSVALLRLDSVGVSREFIVEALQANGYQQVMFFNAGGTTIKHIYITRLVKMKIALPPLTEQQTIWSEISRTKSAYDESIGIVQREIALLLEYRTRLVADVVTGTLDVREAARRLPDEAPAETAEDDTDLSVDPDASEEEAAV